MESFQPSSDESIISSLSTALKSNISKPSKHALVRHEIEKLIVRFSNRLDESVIEEMNRIFVLADRKFIEYRSIHSLCRLAISQYFIQKALLNSAIDSPNSRHVICRFLSTRLEFPFATKKVLGIFIGISFLSKYEFFSDNHLLEAIQKVIPESQHVPGGIYAFERHGDPFKLLYIEIEKKDRRNFSLKERNKLLHFLKSSIKQSVEKLQPSVFMLSNEEEISKSIFILSREITSTTDIPQASIHFEEQTEKDVKFRIILVYLCKDNMFSLQKWFEDHQNLATYLPDRIRIIKYFRKKHPMQAEIFRLSLPKTQSWVRLDASLNFYAARKRISELLHSAIGDYRDYNGGIILKQSETLVHFKKSFQNIPIELLENFFYSLTPTEVQATISSNTLNTFFELFLEVKSLAFPSSTDYVIRTAQKEDRIFCILKIQDVLMQAITKNSDPTKEITQMQLLDADSFFMGYIFERESLCESNPYIENLKQKIHDYKQKQASLQTLRLAIYSNLLSLDPRVRIDEDTKIILKLLFEGLMRIDAHGNVVNGVAESVAVSEDMKKYTFQLRHALWSNGTNVTAYDFVYTWKTILSPHFKTPSAYLFYPIKNAKEVKKGILSTEHLGFRALDAKTLEVELEFPIPYFLELVAQSQFVPVSEKFDQYHPSWSTQQGEKYVCNGAFTIEKNHSLQGCELIKNPLYSASSLIRLNRISIKKAQAYEIENMFLQGDIDWAGFPMGLLSLPSLSDAPQTLSLSNPSSLWYAFNTQRFPFNHPKLRQALAFALNRAKILEKIPTKSQAASTFFPTDRSQTCGMEENREKAIHLFHEALTELNLDLQTFPLLKISHAIGGFREQIADSIKETWEKTFGIQCTIEAHSGNIIFEKLITGDFDISSINWINPINDPAYTLNAFRDPTEAINFPKWHNSDFEALLEKANSELNPAKRLYSFHLAEKKLLEEVPVIPISRTYPYSIKKAHVQIPNHRSLKVWDFKWASIQNN